MAVALIALGSNLGDRLGNLNSALDRLSAGSKVVGVSSVYETEPMYVTDQQRFLNAAASIDTEMGPLGLLRLLKRIEAQVGRAAGERFGPREVDLDLIAYGCAAYRFEHVGKVVVEVPHPRLAERRFVLQPLADVAPDFVIPGIGVVRDLLEATKPQADSVLKRKDADLSLHGV